MFDILKKAKNARRKVARKRGGSVRMVHALEMELRR